MGKLIAKKISGMNVWAKSGLVLILTLVFASAAYFQLHAAGTAGKVYSISLDTGTTGGVASSSITIGSNFIIRAKLIDMATGAGITGVTTGWTLNAAINVTNTANTLTPTTGTITEVGGGVYDITASIANNVGTAATNDIIQLDVRLANGTANAVPASATGATDGQRHNARQYVRVGSSLGGSQVKYVEIQPSTDGTITAVSAGTVSYPFKIKFIDGTGASIQPGTLTWTSSRIRDNGGTTPTGTYSVSAAWNAGGWYDCTYSGTSATLTSGNRYYIVVQAVTGNFTFLQSMGLLAVATPGAQLTVPTFTTPSLYGNAGTIQLSASSYSVNENGTSVTVTATRTGGSSGAAGISYATSNGTATAGSDYTAASGTLSWADGDTANKTFTVNITDDTTYEGNETFTATLSSPTGGATLGTPNSATVTITDNETQPTAQFGTTASSGAESATPATMTVTLSGASSQTITVPFTVTGTATGGGTDYTITASPLTFSPGVTSQNVSATIVNDVLVESNETIIVTLGTPTNATLGTNTAHTYTIIDNDAVVNSTTAGTATAVAASSTSITVTAPYTDDSNANNTLKVEWGTGGTFTLGNQTLPHSATPYTYLITGLTASTQYNVRVTYQDADTVTGTAVQTFTPTTLAYNSPLMHNAANVNPTDTKGYGATWGSTFTCETCHAQSTSNVKLIATTVATPNGPRSVVFTRMTATSDSQTGVFGNDARTYAGNGTGGSSNICEVCHRKTLFHRYSTNAPTPTHYNNQLCLPCHPHSAGFKGSGHNVPLYATTDGHTGCASGIGCHSNSNPAAPYPTAGTAPDCRACHTKADPTVATNGCGSCHGAANGNGEPSGTVHPDAVGSHPAHTALPTACTYCHDTGGTGGNANHGKGNRGANPAVVNLAAAFTWNGTTCSTASCHANPYGTGSTTTPAWGTAAGCSACHIGGGAFAGDGAPATGSHAAHMTAGAVCGSCHAGAVSGSNGGTAHTDGDIDVTNGYPANVTKHAAGTYTGTCSTASCHVSAYGTGYAVSPVWGAAGGCGACHPISGTTGAPVTGSHDKHMALSGAVCNQCHAGAVKDSNGGTAHTDGNIDVTNGYPANVVKHAAGSGYSTCSAASCHSSPYSSTPVTSPTWGAAGAGCGACHNGAGAFIAYSTPSTQSGPNTGSHSAHMNYNRYVCDECHTGAVSGTSGGAAHGDGDIDVTNQGYPVNVVKHTPGTGYSTCTLACHYATPVWGANNIGCINCHAVAITRTKGRPGTTLAAVTTEFGLAWGHKKSGRTAVADADCIVCHLEGNYTTQKTSRYHADGNIDLRAPDVQGETAITNISGTAFTFARFSTSYAAGSRTTTGHTSNTDIANVITQKFCLACHDSNGATNTTARSNNGGTGTAAMPFGGIALGANYTAANGAIGTQGLVDVNTQFATTNSSFHPVRGPRNAGYPTTARLSAPYNNFTRTAGTIAASVVINCFDCHNSSTTVKTLRTIVAHGNAETIRGTATTSGTSPSTTPVTLCIKCHAGYDTNTAANHASGSALTANTNSGMTTYLRYGCNACHASNYDTAVVRPVRAMDVHGVNALPTTGVAKTVRWAGTSTGTPATVNARPYAFIRNTTKLSDHSPNKIGGTTYSANCNMAGTNCNQGVKTYTVGGVY